MSVEIANRMARIIVDFEEMHEQEYLFHYNKEHRKYDEEFYKKMKELVSLYRAHKITPKELFDLAVLKEARGFIENYSSSFFPLRFIETKFLRHLLGPVLKKNYVYEISSIQYQRVFYEEDGAYGVREISTRANAFRFGNMFYIPRFKSLFKQEDIYGEIDFFIERGMKWI